MLCWHRARRKRKAARNKLYCNLAALLLSNFILSMPNSTCKPVLESFSLFSSSFFFKQKTKQLDQLSHNNLKLWLGTIGLSRELINLTRKDASRVYTENNNSYVVKRKQNVIISSLRGWPSPLAGEWRTGGIVPRFNYPSQFHCGFDARESPAAKREMRRSFADNVDQPRQPRFGCNSFTSI